jgi:hypothetical protein
MEKGPEHGFARRLVEQREGCPALLVEGSAETLDGLELARGIDRHVEAASRRRLRERGARERTGRGGHHEDRLDGQSRRSLDARAWRTAAETDGGRA